MSVSISDPHADRKRLEKRLELVAAVVMSIATVFTAWSAFQSSKWGGVMAIEFSRAGAERTESAKATTRGAALAETDVALFTGWLDATASGADELADFYEARFRQEFRPAFEAYLAADPLGNPDAPASPFVLDEYQVERLREADRLAAQADAASQSARDANQQGDNYTLMTVVFASVLFFAGISTKFDDVRAQVLTVGLGAVVLAVAGIGVATFPIEI